MRRVASLFLPEWPLDRLRRAARVPQEPSHKEAGVGLEQLGQVAAAERAKTCSVPNTPEGRPGALWASEQTRAADLSRAHCGSNDGWRPGAKWARADREAEIERLPAHQRPSMRELGRSSEAADHPFKVMPSDEAGATAELSRWRNVRVAVPGEGSLRQIDSPYLGEGRFFVTGRMTGHVVGRTRAGDDIARSRRKSSVDAGAPTVTFHRVDGRDLVHAACPAARALGIGPGVWLSQARACVPGLTILPADPEGDRAALRDLAVALARRWAPTVAMSGEDGLFIDLTGVAHLYGGEGAFARRLVRLLDRLGYAARVAVTDTPGAAWALARHHRDLCDFQVLECPPGTHVDAIEPLPAEALRFEAKHIQLLNRLGVDTVGELARLPRAPLARRFGGELVLRLDQATGRAPEPLEPVAPPSRVAVERRFLEPIATAEAIEHWLSRLVPQLAAALAEAGLGARSVLLTVRRVDGRTQSLRVGFARPNRRPDHLLRLLRRRIGEVDPGFGIDALSLHVIHADPLGPEALAPELADEHAPDLAPLVDLLANRVGAGRVWRVRAVESDVPERSTAICPPLDPSRDTAPKLAADDVRRLDTREAEHPWHPRWPRPALLLPRPEPVEHVMAELPDHPPRRFTWRGTSHRVVRADGPERIAGEWWRRPAERDAVRDYFVLEDEAGRRFWLYRRGDGLRAETGDLSWHLHGAYA